MVIVGNGGRYHRNSCIVTFALEEKAELSLKAAALGAPRPTAPSEIESVASGKRRKDIQPCAAHHERMDRKKSDAEQRQLGAAE